MSMDKAFLLNTPIIFTKVNHQVVALFYTVDGWWSMDAWDFPVEHLGAYVISPVDSVKVPSSSIKEWREPKVEGTSLYVRGVLKSGTLTSHFKVGEATVFAREIPKYLHQTEWQNIQGDADAFLSLKNFVSQDIARTQFMNGVIGRERLLDQDSYYAFATDGHRVFFHRLTHTYPEVAFPPVVFTLLEKGATMYFHDGVFKFLVDGGEAYIEAQEPDALRSIRSISGTISLAGSRHLDCDAKKVLATLKKVKTDFGTLLQHGITLFVHDGKLKMMPVGVVSAVYDAGPSSSETGIYVTLNVAYLMDVYQGSDAMSFYASCNRRDGFAAIHYDSTENAFVDSQGFRFASWIMPMRPDSGHATEQEIQAIIGS